MGNLIKKMLKIATKDGKSVEVSQDVRGMSKLVEQALMDNQEEMVDLPLAQVNEKELKLVVEFCQHHNWSKTDSGIKCPLPKKTLKVISLMSGIASLSRSSIEMHRLNY